MDSTMNMLQIPSSITPLSMNLPVIGLISDEAFVLFCLKSSGASGADE